VEFDVVVGTIPAGGSAENVAYVEWSSFPGDRTTAQSPFNIHSMERWYDPPDPLNIYGGISSIAVVQALTPANSHRLDGDLTWPDTGFAPKQVTPLTQQPDELQYTDFGTMWLEIPSLGVEMPVVGIPFTHAGWDVTWLENQAGYLEGTSYPTLPGNTVLTGHVWNADGLPGPFRNLPNLIYGEQIILHVDGMEYTYEVRDNRSIRPWNLSPLAPSDYDWLVLITCRDYDANTDSYPLRTMVSAVLVNIAAEN
jgi:LPXTG-site transpeptidase (sortase) family protein